MQVSEDYVRKSFTIVTTIQLCLNMFNYVVIVIVIDEDVTTFIGNMKLS